MTPFAYALFLIISFAGMSTVDYKHRLALFKDRARTVKTIALAVCFFLVWDILGIILGIFFHGPSLYDTNIMIAPELPLEELLFLTFFCYITLILWRLLEKLWPRT